MTRIRFSIFTAIFFLMIFLVACSSSQETVTVKETVISELPVTVEVTRVIERFVDLEVTRLIEVTRIVVVTLSPTDTPTPEPVLDFQRFTSQDAIDAFIAAGLEVVSPAPIDPNEQNPVPKTFIEAQRFLIPSLGSDRGARVFSFENPEELAAVRDYYEGFTGVFASWIFVKDNLVFQVGIDLSKATAEQYQSVLEAFG